MFFQSVGCPKLFNILRIIFLWFYVSKKRTKEKGTEQNRVIGTYVKFV